MWRSVCRRHTWLLPRSWWKSPKISSNLARSSVPQDAIEQLQILEQQLTTRDSLLAIAERFGVYGNDSKIPPSEIVNDMRARTSLEPVPLDTPAGSNGAIVFAISFEAEDPVLAADVANSFADTIIESNTAQRKKRAADTLDFFQRDVDRLKGVLNAAQDAVLNFKNENRDSLPETLEFRQMRQNNYQESLRQLEREENSLRNRRLTIEQALANPNTPLNTGNATPDEQTLADLRRALAEQQAIFKQDSPNLRALRDRISALEQALVAKRTTTEDASQSKEVPPEVQMQLADIDSQLAFVAQEKESLTRLLADLSQSIARTAGTATVLATLEQSYQTAQTQYNDATARLAEASTGERIESQAIGERLALVEAATPPLKPIKPHRRTLAAGSLIAGVGLAAGLIILLEMLMPTIRRPSELAAIFPDQPFVTIPYMRSPGNILRQRLTAAAIVLAIAAAVPGLLVARKHLLPAMSAALNTSIAGVRDNSPL